MIYHVSLAVRKALAARIAAFEEMESFLDRTLDDVTRQIGYGYCDSLYLETDNEINTPQNEKGLDAFVQGLATALYDRVRDDQRAAARPLDRPAADLLARVRSISCAACAQPATICDGREAHDMPIVRQGGRCMAPLRDLFEFALEVGRIYYEYACGSVIAGRWPACELASSFTNGPPHLFPVDIHVSGRTQFEPETAIEVVVNPKKFDFPSFLALPYVLVHEAFHLLEGSDQIERTKASDEDPFVEGWIDRVAFRVFEDVAIGRGPAAHLQTKLRWPQEQTENAGQLHDGRFRVRGHGSPGIHQLRLGRRAADQFFDFCQRFLEEEEAWQFFLAVSLTFNLKNLPLEAHISAVAKVARRIVLRSEERSIGFTPDGPRILAEFRDLVHDCRPLFDRRDVSAFVDWLLEA